MTYTDVGISNGSNTATIRMRGGDLRVNTWLVGTTPTFELSGDNKLQVEGPTLMNNSLTVSGSILPSADASSDLGSSSKRFANIFSADLQLSNENTQGNEVDGTTGNWTIQEGNDDLFIINRKTGKKYKFLLEEVK